MSRKGSELKQRIVDRALELFNDHGLERVGIRDLARDLALSPGNLTYHFARKEDLVLAIAARFSADNTAILSAHPIAPAFNQFFDALQPVLANQYRYRCLTLNLVNVLDAYPDLAARYRANQQLRRTQFEHWVQHLKAMGRLRPDLTAREVDWLVGYCQLVGRTWMQEYWLVGRGQPVAHAIAHSLSLLAAAFQPYASPTGQQELTPYLAPLVATPTQSVDVVGSVPDAGTEVVPAKVLVPRA